MDILLNNTITRLATAGIIWNENKGYSIHTDRLSWDNLLLVVTKYVNFVYCLAFVVVVLLYLVVVCVSMDTFFLLWYKPITQEK